MDSDYGASTLIHNKLLMAAFAGCVVMGPAIPVAAQLGSPTLQLHDSIMAIHGPAMYGGVATDSIMSKLGWLNYQIWEFNDEQRLNNGSNGYGPIAFIYASDALDGMTLATFNAAGSGGALVGLLLIQPNLKSDAPTRVASLFPVRRIERTGVAITPQAVIKAAAALNIPALPQTYRKLGASMGYNCIYLAHTGSDPMAQWLGYVVPTRISGNPCPDAHVPVAPVPVKPARFGNFTDHKDYPPVARFHEGSLPGTGMRVPLFGLKCAAAWCYFLPAMPGADTLPRPFANPRNEVTYQVPGWQDFQHLAKRKAGGGPNDLIPDWGFSGAIVADPLLGIRTLGDYSSAGTANSWIHVATIHTEGPPPTDTKYHTRWRLQAGANEMYLRLETGGWNGILIVGNTGTAADTVPLSVYRTDHSPRHVPGTVRWRWVDQDEEVWVRCEEGCCKVAPASLSTNPL